MAFGSRYSFLVIFFSVAVALCVLFAAFSVLMILFLVNTDIDFFSSQSFWFIYETTGHGMLESIIAAVCLVAGGFIAFYLFRIMFRKTGSAEVFFIALFFFSLLFEVFRCGMYLVEIAGIAEYFSLVGTRIVFFGRLFGLLCLFAASLYGGDFHYQKFEIVIGVSILIAGFLAFSISFDKAVMLSNGLLKMSDESGLFIIFTALKGLVIANYVIFNAKKHSLHSIGGILLVLSGRELLFFSLNPVFLGIGICAGIAGCILLYRTLENYYNWI